MPHISSAGYDNKNRWLPCTKFTIYTADEYDRLVRYEDYKGNLKRFLLRKIDWQGKVVFEADIGTGRVTIIFIETLSGVWKKIKYLIH